MKKTNKQIPRSPMKKRNSRVGDNPGARRAYREQNPRCELAILLKHTLGTACCNRTIAIDIHHICGGIGARYDVPSNFLSVCRVSHELIEGQSHLMSSRDGRIVSCIVKHAKGELDPSMRTCSNQMLGGFLANNPPDDSRLLAAWTSMVQDMK